MIGYNDIPEAALADPLLTTVEGMGVEKGRIAAHIVFEAGPVRRKLLQTRLVVHASTTAPWHQ